jgi:hypothetical protein
MSLLSDLSRVMVERKTRMLESVCRRMQDDEGFPPEIRNLAAEANLPQPSWHVGRYRVPERPVRCFHGGMSELTDERVEHAAQRLHDAEPWLYGQHDGEDIYEPWDEAPESVKDYYRTEVRTVVAALGETEPPTVS